MNSNRRTFVLGSALGATAAMSQQARAQSSAKIPTAVIGTGNRGSHLLQGVLEQPNAKVVAVCDNKPDRLDKAASTAAKDNPKTYSDWRKVIDNKDIEAVYIATPPHLHAEMAVAALNAGKHVYCEKPIGITPRHVQDIMNAVASSGRVFVSGQQLRSFTQLQEAIDKIHGGVIGKIAMVKAQRHAERDLPYDGSSGDWYYDVNKSGGYLIEQSVHNLDACNWILNEHPIRCSGFGGILMHKDEPKGRNTFDCGSMSFEYPSGAIMTFTQNVFHPRGLPSSGQPVLVFGEKGAVDFLYSTNLFLNGGNGTGTPLAAARKEETHAQTTAFFDCITKGGKNPADVNVGATGALTAILGHMAMTKGTTVDWIDMGVAI